MTDEERASEVTVLTCCGEEHCKRNHNRKLQKNIAAALSQARAEERERCAKVAEAVAFDSEPGVLPSFDDGYVQAGEDIAHAIRRGE